MRHLYAATLALLISISPANSAETANETRLDEIAKRGAQVMPFNLDQTTHVFTKTESGGVQQVIAKEPSCIRQIKLIREHLLNLSTAFARGDFSGPAKIHGKGMPGLAELQAAKIGSIKIEYSELPNGAQLTYSTDNSALISAIHRWFDAQLSDHARHAVPGQPQHHMHR